MGVPAGKTVRGVPRTCCEQDNQKENPGNQDPNTPICGYDGSSPMLQSDTDAEFMIWALANFVY